MLWSTFLFLKITKMHPTTSKDVFYLIIRTYYQLYIQPKLLGYWRLDSGPKELSRISQIAAVNRAWRQAALPFLYRWIVYKEEFTKSSLEWTSNIHLLAPNKDGICYSDFVQGILISPLMRPQNCQSSYCNRTSWERLGHMLSKLQRRDYIGTFRFLRVSCPRAPEYDSGLVRDLEPFAYLQAINEALRLAAVNMNAGDVVDSMWLPQVVWAQANDKIHSFGLRGRGLRNHTLELSDLVIKGTSSKSLKLVSQTYLTLVSLQIRQIAVSLARQTVAIFVQSPFARLQSLTLEFAQVFSRQQAMSILGLQLPEIWSLERLDQLTIANSPFLLHHILPVFVRKMTKTMDLLDIQADYWNGNGVQSLLGSKNGSMGFLGCIDWVSIQRLRISHNGIPALNWTEAQKLTNAIMAASMPNARSLDVSLAVAPETCLSLAQIANGNWDGLRSLEISAPVHMEDVVIAIKSLQQLVFLSVYGLMTDVNCMAQITGSRGAINTSLQYLKLQFNYHCKAPSKSTCCQHLQIIMSIPSLLVVSYSPSFAKTMRSMYSKYEPKDLSPAHMSNLIIRDH